MYMISRLAADEHSEAVCRVSSMRSWVHGNSTGFLPFQRACHLQFQTLRTISSRFRRLKNSTYMEQIRFSLANDRLPTSWRTGSIRMYSVILLRSLYEIF